ncbi:MAG: PHP domain-containing protein [Candidatus Micrarchaeota archaeon]
MKIDLEKRVHTIPFAAKPSSPKLWQTDDSVCRIDFHVHTNHSIDSTIKPKDLVSKSRKLGIIPAIADHNTISSFGYFKSNSFDFFPAEEICVKEGYDLIGIYLTEAIPKKTPFREAIDMIREQGALSYLPHMFDKTRRGCSDIALAKKADIIEVFNGRCFSSFNKQADNFAELHKKPKGAGSDSHFLFEFGKTYVEIKGDFSDYGENPKLLLKSLKNAKIVAKNAPIYVRGTTKLVSIVKKFL